MLQHLSEAPEDAFDKTYLDQQVLAQEEIVSLMESYGEGGANPQLFRCARQLAGCEGAPCPCEKSPSEYLIQNESRYPGDKNFRARRSVC